jgi:hypothetical protein
LQIWEARCKLVLWVLNQKVAGKKTMSAVGMEEYNDCSLSIVSSLYTCCQWCELNGLCDSGLIQVV